MEGTRTDVKVVNLSYLTTDWYVDQVRRPSYEAPGIDMQAKPTDYAYDRLQYAYFLDNDTTPAEALASLRQIYSPEARQNSWGLPIVKHPNMYVPVDTAALVAAGRITSQEALAADDVIPVNLLSDPHPAAEPPSRQQRLEPPGLLRHDRAGALLHEPFAVSAQQRSGL